jgi:hypothetical protein
VGNYKNIKEVCQISDNISKVNELLTQGWEIIFISRDVLPYDAEFRSNRDKLGLRSDAKTTFILGTSNK